MTDTIPQMNFDNALARLEQIGAQSVQRELVSAEITAKKSMAKAIKDAAG
jgi:hypothetical protein